MHPQTPEQQSVLMVQPTSAARQGADRQVPFSQIPVQHWDGFVQTAPAGRQAHFFLPLGLTMW